ncbi:uncharacterized protein [Linepithema humile]|uniref:uncharacterized protein isoform X2 n=1 Tax=Linepithema humile TaxID=83485 RepID=UPI00351E0D0F
MYITEERYYIVNKNILKILGIWSEEESLLVLLQRILITIIFILSIGTQLAVFITSRYNMTLFIKIMSITFPVLLISLKYYTFIFKSETLKILHYEIQEDFKILRDKLEEEIIQKHAHAAQLYMNIILLLFGSIMIGIMILQLFPIILDIILPLDEPRPCKPILMLEYFVPQDEYLYTIILHEFIMVLLFGSVLLATATQLLILIYHSFGMFKIASHRIKYSIEESVLYTTNLEKESAICNRIMHAVIAHRRAVGFADAIITSFNVPYCIICVVGVLSLSINLFRFVQDLMSKDMGSTILSFIATLGHLLYMFAANYIGQIVSDSNRELFTLLYNTSWYLMPVPSQKLILFLMQKIGKDYYFTLGYIFVAKVESFATVRNTKT